MQEVKNGIFGSFAAMLVGAGFFRTFSHEHLPVGHTHEDIGTLARIQVVSFTLLSVVNLMVRIFGYFLCRKKSWKELKV